VADGDDPHRDAGADDAEEDCGSEAVPPRRDDDDLVGSQPARERHRRSGVLDGGARPRVEDELAARPLPRPPHELGLRHAADGTGPAGEDDRVAALRDGAGEGQTRGADSVERRAAAVRVAEDGDDLHGLRRRR
jgi:hypothetical protein